MNFLRISMEILRSAVVDLGRRPVSSGLSVVALTVALFVLAVFLVLTHGVRDVLSRWSDQAAVEVFLSAPLDDPRVAELVARFEQEPAVRRVEAVDSGQALEEFEQLFPDLGDVATLLGENPFSGSLRIVPATPDSQAVSRIAKLAQASEVVEAVRYDRQWLRSLARLGRALGGFMLVGAVILLFASLVTVGAVVRLALDDKREEVELMRLVGAPVSFVVGPVLFSGALLGLLGALLALGLVSAGRHLALDAAAATSLGALAELVLGRGLPPAEQVGVALVGALAGTLAAGLAAGRAALR
ncbi:MAG: permease-like cell division protein FtsX [Acidobacteriota bacterium]|nr:permease-like cell division protein FtsX [Acidobacteriota bacterium]MDQ7088749.1 permease-like cell division protein FtsX [Acidobacteriota bacterium]